MLQALLRALLRAFGKHYYTPDPDLPLCFILQILMKRLLWLVIGIIRFRQIVFVSPSASIRGASRIQLGHCATIEPHARIDGYARNPVSIGARSLIGAYTIILCTSHMSTFGIGLRIGDDCGIAEYCFIGAAGGVTLGNDVIVGQYVSFHSQNHNFNDPTRIIREQGVTSRGIRIGNNVWIGAKATILDGAEVGDGSVIAAGAVVNGKYPPGSVIGGVPARVLRSISTKGIIP